jgi:hypothetical protein
MTSETDRASFGIQVLKVFCLLAFISSLVGVIFPFHPIHVPGLIDDRLHRAISFSNGLLLGGLFYGIHRRLVIAWTFGWVLLIVLFGEFLISTLSSILRQTPYPAGWILSAVAAVMASAVAAYWGRWWNRQRGYFSRPGF